MVMSHLKAGFDVSKVGVPMVYKLQRERGRGISPGRSIKSRALGCPLCEVSIHASIPSFNKRWLEYLVCPSAGASARDTKVSYLWPLWNPVSAEWERHRNNCKIITDPCDKCR